MSPTWARLLPVCCRVLALLETTSFAIGLAGPILIALVGFTIFAAEVRPQIVLFDVDTRVGHR